MQNPPKGSTKYCMKVMKFGGTSVGTVDSLKNLKQIVEGLTEPAIIVVSALGGLTDRLIATARDAASGNGLYKTEMPVIRGRHYEIIDALISADRREEVRTKIDGLLNELNDVFRGISLIRALPERTLDLVVSFGERMSSILVSAIVGADFHDSLEYVRTEQWFTGSIADRKLTEELIRKEFSLPLTNNAVTGGFISRDRETREITNLGRGGSDYTAALIAAALDAELLEIWTDVDGFLTTDPRVVSSAHIIPEMTFVESMELCNFGAKVVYPPTIYPVFHKNIPIKILNTFNPSAPGTLISDFHFSTPEVRGVSLMKGTALLTVEGSLTINVAQINTRGYNALARNGIGVLVVGEPIRHTALAIVVPQKDSTKAFRELEVEFGPDIRQGTVTSVGVAEGMAIIAVVGESIKKIAGLGSRLVNILERKGISVEALSDGASESTIAIVVSDNDAAEALKLVHEAAIQMPR